MRIRGTLVLTLAFAGCHRTHSGDVVARCESTGQSVLHEASVARLAGVHRMIFVATSGSRAGQFAEGRLELWGQSDSLRAGPWSPAEQRLIGTLDVPPEELGGSRVGENVEGDPLQPVVGVYVAPANGGVTVIARVGSFSNRRGDSPFDASYFALHVREVDDRTIRGMWSSGDGRSEVAAGHFCAFRRS